MTLRKIARVVAAVLLVCLMMSGLYLWQIQRTGNFHSVVVGELYRSNQPTPDRLARYQRDVHIRTILNLRGARPGAPWYEAERKAAKNLGLTLIDFPMSDHEVLSPNRVDALVRAMADAPKPLLIHCKAGADRSGLAAALYLARISHTDPEVAEGQLSIVYGHFSVPWLSRAWPMDVSFEAAEHALPNAGGQTVKTSPL